MEQQLIIGCKKQNKQSQQAVYQLLAPKLFALSKRYLKKQEDREEVLADAFFTIFTKIDQLKELDAFEAWAKRITVNQCLLYLRRNVNFNLYIEDIAVQNQPLSDESTDLETQDLLNLLEYLPDGCKIVFNLFVIEGYSHKEIAQALNISEGTSKSQLNVAKNKLKNKVQSLYYQKEQS
jgi:RNA polymerase sigma-70 factor (ECF subfamily)